MLDLGPLAYDVDGDPLTWTLEGGTADVSVSQVNNSMVFTPRTDFFGVIEDVTAECNRRFNDAQCGAYIDG